MVSVVRLTSEFNQEVAICESRGFLKGNVTAHCIHRGPFKDVPEDGLEDRHRIALEVGRARACLEDLEGARKCNGENGKSSNEFEGKAHDDGRA